jgi:ABC-2 type transport system permease protein
MTALSYAAADSATMLRRNLKHMLRYPTLIAFVVLIPIVLMLMFVYVFGGTLGNGVGGPIGGRAAYLAYLVPGILLMTVAGGAQGTAITVSMDMTKGIIARFRTMAISRGAVLTGHVVGSVIQTVIGLLMVFAVAVAIGYRSNATVPGWLGAAGMLLMMTFALTWLTVALGLVARNVESASNTPMFLTLLPFLGSGFVPTSSMPVGLRWFAEYQPFTPMIETVRHLLSGTPVGHEALIATIWCVALSVAGYLWSRRLYIRRTNIA